MLHTHLFIVFQHVSSNLGGICPGHKIFHVSAGGRSANFITLIALHVFETFPKYCDNSLQFARKSS